MTAFIETGHARNLSSLQQLIAACIGYGSAYAPSVSNLSITALTTCHTDGQSLLADVLAKKTDYRAAINLRIEAFAILRKKSTRILNALKASGASAEVVANAREYHRKIQGSRASKPPTNSPDPNAPVPKTISNSQQSFDQLIQHLAGLISVVNIAATYAPNETDLKVTSLNTYRLDLDSKNSDVNTTYVAVSNARLARDKKLYSDSDSAYILFSAVKSYIRSVFGATSSEYRQISGLAFKKPKN